MTLKNKLASRYGKYLDEQEETNYFFVMRAGHYKDI